MIIKMWREDRLGELFGQIDDSHCKLLDESMKPGGVKICDTDINMNRKKNRDREPSVGCKHANIAKNKINFKDKKKREKMKKICCSVM